MAGTGLFLGLLLWALSANGYSEPAVWSPRALGELAALSTSTVISYAAWDVAMRRGDVVFVVALSYFTPLLATVASHGVGYVRRVRNDPRVTLLKMRRHTGDAMVGDILRRLKDAGVIPSTR